MSVLSLADEGLADAIGEWAHAEQIGEAALVRLARSVAVSQWKQPNRSERLGEFTPAFIDRVLGAAWHL